MAPLLMHSEAVPAEAREALKAAWFGPAEHRAAQLESAAQLLYRHAGLDCSEARDLLGLPSTGRCG